LSFARLSRVRLFDERPAEREEKRGRCEQFSLRRRRCLSVLGCRSAGAWAGRRLTSNELNGATHQCLSERYADTHSSRPAKSLLWWRTRHEASERRVWACKEHERASVDYPPCKRAGNVHLVEDDQENDGKEGQDIHLSRDPAHAIFTAGGHVRPAGRSVLKDTFSLQLCRVRSNSNLKL